MSDKKRFWARQPGKALYTTFTILSSFVYLPFLMIYYVPPNLRQHSKWSYRQALTSQMSRLYFDFVSTIEMSTAWSLEPGKDKERFSTIQPADKDLYRGPLADSQIRPATIGGIWLPGPYEPTRDKGKRVVLHFHGGAYVTMSPRWPNMQSGPKMLEKEMSAVVLCVQYRLSSHPGGRFPAALQDAVTSFQHLLDLGVPPSQIILSGDSAGGHLATSLLRYISDQKGILPSPFAALLWSPWLNLADPHAVDKSPNSKIDFIGSALLEWGVRSFVPSFMRVYEPYISPLNHPFATETRIFVQTGTAEVLRDDALAFVDNMKGISGNQIGLHEVLHAPHDMFISAEGMGVVTEPAASIAEAQLFFQSSSD